MLCFIFQCLRVNTTVKHHIKIGVMTQQFAATQKSNGNFFLRLGILPLHFGFQHSAYSHSLRVSFLAGPKKMHSGKDFRVPEQKKCVAVVSRKRKYEEKCGEMRLRRILWKNAERIIPRPCIHGNQGNCWLTSQGSHPFPH